MKTQPAEVTTHTEAISLKLDSKEYEISWGELTTGGKGIMILSSDQVEVVERSNEGYWLIVR